MTIRSDINWKVIMFLDPDTFSVCTDGDIRWIRGDRILSLEEFHEELTWGKAEEDWISKLEGGVLELKEPFNIDDEMAKHLTGGVLVQYGVPTYVSNIGWEAVEEAMDVQSILDQKRYVFHGNPLFVPEPPLWLEDGDQMDAVASTTISGITGVVLNVSKKATITMEVGFFKQLYALSQIQKADEYEEEPENKGDHDGQVYNPYTKRWSWI